jgi:hypothetical protein
VAHAFLRAALEVFSRRYRAAGITLRPSRTTREMHITVLVVEEA